ncbi:MAG: hypothetical protein P4L83_23335 [Nevskia sp.]|nr:hypothetical protein [Nevskia sp.]
MNKLLRYGVLGAFVGSGLGVSALADPAVQMDKRDPGIEAGPLKITFGGFTELAGIYRKRNETADVGSSFNSLPFPNAPQYFEPEFRESARQSRFAMKVEGPADAHNKAEAYFETDFLSAGVTSNSNESNSYTLRMRVFYADWHHDDWYVLAGQNWSLATLYKKGLDIRQENVPATIDAQYVAGFNWARQAQFRVVKSFGNFGALGLSLEEPQNVIKGTPPTGANGNSSGGSLLNSTTTYSDDIAPDLVVKYAVDPGFGHYELYSLTRFLHDRAPSTPGSVATTENHTTTAESIGGGMILPLVPKMLDFQASGLIGHGNGRYGSGSLADSTFNTGNGSIAALKEQQALVGLVAHATSRLDTYMYAGIEHETASNSLIPGSNGGCGVLAGSCGGIGTVREITGGAWWKFYKGSLGYLSTGAQVEYFNNATYVGKDGSVGRTDDTMVMLSFRYYPYQ